MSPSLVASLLTLTRGDRLHTVEVDSITIWLALRGTMKILMFGRGVLFTIYGRALAQAGHEVEFSVRPGRAATYGDGSSST